MNSDPWLQSPWRPSLLIDDDTAIAIDDGCYVFLVKDEAGEWWADAHFPIEVFDLLVRRGMTESN